MPGIICNLDLDSIVCNETCFGPGADQIRFRSALYDSTVDPWLLIHDTDQTIGPFKMDKQPATPPAVSTLGQRIVFQNVKYGRPPCPPGASPDNLILMTWLLRGDAAVIPIPLTIKGVKIDLGAIIGFIVDFIEGHVIGANSHKINMGQAQTPQGQRFSDTDTGCAANYTVKYSFRATAFAGNCVAGDCDSTPAPNKNP